MQQIDRSLRLAKNFTLKEMIEGPAINGTYYEMFWKALTPALIKNLTETAVELQKIRDAVNLKFKDYFGLKPEDEILLLVNCAFRAPAYEVSRNRKQDGTHPKGEAADWYLKSKLTGRILPLMPVYRMLNNEWKYKGGLAINLKQNFIHSDVRVTNPPRRWSY